VIYEEEIVLLALARPSYNLKQVGEHRMPAEAGMGKEHDE
jgi:hypothetical protein